MVFARKYGKGIGSAVVTLAVAWLMARQQGAVGVGGWFSIVGSLASTIAVVGLQNTVLSPAIKAVAQTIGVLATGVGALIAGGGLNDLGLVALLIQAVSVWGVYQIPNVGDRYALAVGRHRAGGPAT